MPDIFDPDDFDLNNGRESSSYDNGRSSLYKPEPWYQRYWKPLVGIGAGLLLLILMIKACGSNGELSDEEKTANSKARISAQNRLNNERDAAFAQIKEIYSLQASLVKNPYQSTAWANFRTRLDSLKLRPNLNSGDFKKLMDIEAKYNANVELYRKYINALLDSALAANADQFKTSYMEIPLNAKTGSNGKKKKEKRWLSLSGISKDELRADSTKNVAAAIAAKYGLAYPNLTDNELITLARKTYVVWPTNTSPASLATNDRDFKELQETLDRQTEQIRALQRQLEENRRMEIQELQDQINELKKQQGEEDYQKQIRELQEQLKELQRQQVEEEYRRAIQELQRQINDLQKQMVP